MLGRLPTRFDVGKNRRPVPEARSCALPPPESARHHCTPGPLAAPSSTSQGSDGPFQAASSPRLEMHSHSCPRATPRACPAPSAITASGGEPGVAWIDAGKQSRECEFTGESHSGIDAASSSCRVTQYSVSLPLSPSLPLSLYLIITILPTPLPSTSSCPSICMSRCVCTQTRVWVEGLGSRHPYLDTSPPTTRGFSWVQKGGVRA